MEANELRIGDYVKFMLNDEDYEIISIDVKDLELIEKKQGVYEPIPLTEEWLLKFGFLKDLENDIFLNINAYAFLYWQNDRVELLDDDNNFMISHCDYVHQLQNLYFALTGKELTFKSE